MDDGAIVKNYEKNLQSHGITRSSKNGSHEEIKKILAEFGNVEYKSEKGNVNLLINYIP